MQKFDSTGTVCDLRHVSNASPVRLNESIEAIRESIAEMHRTPLDNVRRKLKSPIDLSGESFSPANTGTAAK